MEGIRVLYMEVRQAARKANIQMQRMQKEELQRESRSMQKEGERVLLEKQGGCFTCRERGQIKESNQGHAYGGKGTRAEIQHAFQLRGKESGNTGQMPGAWDRNRASIWNMLAIIPIIRPALAGSWIRDRKRVHHKPQGEHNQKRCKRGGSRARASLHASEWRAVVSQDKAKAPEANQSARLNKLNDHTQPYSRPSCETAAGRNLL